MALLRPVLVFAGLGVSILILWFWVPWLVWPERYMGVARAARDGPGRRSRARAERRRPGRRRRDLEEREG